MVLLKEQPHVRWQRQDLIGHLEAERAVPLHKVATEAVILLVLEEHHGNVLVTRRQGGEHAAEEQRPAAFAAPRLDDINVLELDASRTEQALESRHELILGGQVEQDAADHIGSVVDGALAELAVARTGGTGKRAPGRGRLDLTAICRRWHAQRRQV